MAASSTRYVAKKKSDIAWLDGMPGSLSCAPAGRDSLMSRLRILEKIALITAPVMHSTDAASRRQTSTPNAVPETRTRVDASVSSAFLADMDIGAARSGERASGAVGKGGSGAVRSGGRVRTTAEAQCGARKSSASEVERMHDLVRSPSEV